MPMVMLNNDPDPYDPLVCRLVEWSNLSLDEAYEKAERIRMGLEPYPDGFRKDDFDEPAFTLPDLTLGGRGVVH